MSEGHITPRQTLRFNICSTRIKKKIIIKFRKFDQNTQIALDQTPEKKGRDLAEAFN